VERDWQLKEQFVVRDLQSALAADALSTSHPMTQSVDSPNSIRSIFDTISYEKGIFITEIRVWFSSVFLNKFILQLICGPLLIDYNVKSLTSYVSLSLQ
jgi:hypothetical protein